MLNLLWSVLNLLLFVGLLYILFRAARLVRQHMGWGSLLFFLVALLTLSGRSPETASATSRNLLSHEPKGIGANASSQQEIALGGTNKLVLLAEYRINNGIVEPLGLFPSVSGIVLGHTWKPIGGLLRPSGPQVQYDVVIQHKWLLLGMEVFGQIEQFRGIMPSSTQP